MPGRAARAQAHAETDALAAHRQRRHQGWTGRFMAAECRALPIAVIGHDVVFAQSSFATNWRLATLLAARFGARSWGFPWEFAP
jgi:hypothetical protein